MKRNPINNVPIAQARINDPFWSPKMATYSVTRSRSALRTQHDKPGQML